MKRLIHITLFLFLSMQLFSQTDGISYQAVIIGPDNQELPGVDAQGNILPNATIAMRFTIFDSNNQIEFQEEQTTSTDQYGRINLIIGETDPAGFTMISWDGSTKNLLVEIDFDGGGNGYIEMSQQELLFVPYAYHRNITATGTLKVDGATELYSELAVDGITDLNDILNVNNSSATNLSGELNVDGETNLNSNLDVEGITNLNSSLNVEGVTTLGDSLTVDGAMELNDNFTVNGIAHLNDSLIVAGPTDLNNDLKVEGVTRLNDSLLVEGATALNNSLDVDGVTSLNDSLVVEGPTALNNSLNVDAITTLNDSLLVAGATDLNSSLEVERRTVLNDSLTVAGPTDLNNSLNVEGATALNDSLSVEGPTDLNNRLNVEGITSLNDSLKVEGSAKLNSNLIVNGVTKLENGLFVNGITNLNDPLIVSDSTISIFLGELQVHDTAEFLGATKFQGPSTFKELQVNGPSNLEGKLTITANPENGNKNNINAYPLLIQGSKQGIAIKVNGTRDLSNNFISFWDNADNGKMWGRISGLSYDQLINSDDYIHERRAKNWAIVAESYNTTKAGWELGLSIADIVAASTSSTACVGFGACVTTPIPSLIVVASITTVFKAADLVLSIVNLGLSIHERVQFHDYQVGKLGVTYSSGSGDYAEWLPKENLSDTFTEGELVGVKNGLVTKNTWGVEKIMIVSTQPIVLGNMPQQNDEENNVKIAFMGQVPATVIGEVEPGDYILPSELGSGFGKAVHPEDMKTQDYKKIAGVAWSVLAEIEEGINMVNVAVGINTNDLIDVLYQQEEELIELKEIFKQLENQVLESNRVLANLIPGYAEAMGSNSDSNELEDNKIEKSEIVESDFNLAYHNENDIIYFEISEDQIRSAIDMAREQYQEMLNDPNGINKLLTDENNVGYKGIENMALIPIEEHPFWQKIDSDPEYKNEIVNLIQSKLEKAFHTHKEYAHKFTDLKVRE